MTDRPSSGVARLLLVCHASTAATARAVFPGDEPLDENGLRRAAAAAPLGARPAVRGPELRCARTAEALGLRAEPDPLLADCDYGRWRGRTLDEVGAAEPEALATWLDDPAAAPHGGEPVTALLGGSPAGSPGCPPEGSSRSPTPPSSAPRSSTPPAPRPVPSGASTWPRWPA